MTSIDGSAVFVLFLASALAGALFGVAAPWRRMMGGNPSPPVRRLLMRRGESSTATEELRCALCPFRASCARRVAAGAATPVADCPNARLFSRTG